MSDLVIRKISLNNFRNHENYNLNCDNKTTLILGENGRGKTSVLEAIYIALIGKSFRATDKDIVKRGTNFYRIEIQYENGEKIKVIYENQNKKTFLIKDKKTSRLPKNNKYPIVLFLPEDLHIIATSPTKRRDYFDRLISTMDEKYSNSLSRYNKALKQRNELLKQDHVSSDMLFPWDIMLTKTGVEIRKKRKNICELINRFYNQTYKSIVDNDDIISLQYKGDIDCISEDQYLKNLTLNYDKDCVLGCTNYGIHKEDYKFIFNNVDANGSASRGEMRSIILALKFIEANIIQDTTKKKPLILLDDVFSELDNERQRRLVENFKDHQVILTSVAGIN